MAACAAGRGGQELVAGLRQCDGEHVQQAIVMVRDDFSDGGDPVHAQPGDRFWLPITILAVVDLFDLRHARKVSDRVRAGLRRPLPERTADFSRDQESFSRSSGRRPGQDFKIVSVRLACFARWLKANPGLRRRCRGRLAG